MSYFHLFYIFVVFQAFCYCYVPDPKSFDHRHLNCKDNYGLPMDWWYLYKPPRNSGPNFESGANFTYITSRDAGRFQPSYTYINYNSMLQNSLAPLYKKNILAILSYGENIFGDTSDLVSTSTAFGVLFANSLSGVWITHTIPGFLDLTKTPPVIPEEEYSKGHMIMCMSVTLETVNALAAIIRHTTPNIAKVVLPRSLMNALPEWKLLETEVDAELTYRLKTKLLNTTTRTQSVPVIILARSSEDSRCLYTTFTRSQGLVMDVYSNTQYRKVPVCEAAYSVRYINSISLKFPEQNVYYINNRMDRMSFAVSTAAFWQRTGQNSHQYWTCHGNIDSNGLFPAKGGLITCVNHYLVWSTFDNLKVKEPEC